MSRRAALFLMLSLVTVGASCGGDGTGPGQAAVASVTVTPPLDTIAPAATVQLTATPKDRAGNPLSGRTVVWASANQAVATVSTTGLVTGVADGVATMTATSEGKSGAAAVTVRFMFASITAGYAHTCGLTGSGVAYCWGANPFFQLGNGSRAPSATPIAVSGGLRFSSLTTYSDNTCGIVAGGTAYCWGSGAIVQADSPTAVSGGHVFASLSAGGSHDCGVTTSGDAYCWGDNTFGQLGDVNVSNSNDPTLVVGGRSFASVSAGYLHTCAVANGGAAYCWGSGSTGDLGNGLRNNQNFAPVAVAGGHAFASVNAGLSFTCGISTDSMAYCWGANASGRLGNGSTADTALPVAVAITVKIASLDLSTLDNLNGASGFACAVTLTGAAYCWGANRTGQLGNGSTDSTPLPVAVSGGLAFRSVSAGGTHTCGVTKSGDAYCWGDNSSGQLGDGTTIDRRSPVLVLEPQVLSSARKGQLRFP